MYAPYKNRDSFWDSLSDSSLLNVDNLIMAWGLNFTTSPIEIWGQNAKIDSMVDLFINLLGIFDLIDIIPPVLEPTWTNGRSGKEGILKRLDKFVIKASLV